MWYSNFYKKAQAILEDQTSISPPTSGINLSFGEIMSDIAVFYPEVISNLDFLNWLKRRNINLRAIYYMYNNGDKKQAADWVFSLYQNFLNKTPIHDPLKLSPDTYQAKNFLMGSPMGDDQSVGVYMYKVINSLSHNGLDKLVKGNPGLKNRIFERINENKDFIQKVINENYDNPMGLIDISNIVLQEILPLYIPELQKMGKELNIDTLSLLNSSKNDFNPFNSDDFSKKIIGLLNGGQFDDEFKKLFLTYFHQTTEFILENPEYKEKYQEMLLNLYSKPQAQFDDTKGKICLKIAQHISMGLIDNNIVNIIKEDILKNDPNVYLSQNYQYLTLCEIIFDKVGGDYQDYYDMFLKPRIKYEFDKGQPVIENGKHVFKEVIPSNSFALGSVSPASIYAKMEDIPTEEAIECIELLFKESRKMLDPSNMAKCMGILSNESIVLDNDVSDILNLMDSEDNIYEKYDHYNLKNRILSQILKRENLTEDLQQECITRFLKYNNIQIDYEDLEKDIDINDRDQVLRQAQEIFDLDITIPVFRALGIKESVDFIFNQDIPIEQGGGLDHSFAIPGKSSGFGKEVGDPAGGLCVFFACNIETARLYQQTKARPSGSSVFVAHIDIRDIIEARILLGLETDRQWRRQTYSYSEDPDILAAISQNNIPKNKKEILLNIIKLLHSAREITTPRSVHNKNYDLQMLLLKESKKKKEIAGRPILAYNNGWYNYFYLKDSDYGK